MLEDLLHIVTGLSLGQVLSSFPRLVSQGWVAPLFKQHDDGTSHPIAACQHERSIPFHVLQVGVGARINKQMHLCQVPEQGQCDAGHSCPLMQNRILNRGSADICLTR